MPPSAAQPSEPPATSATTNDVPAFGWRAYAERVNGRFAMVGFVAILLLESLSGQTFLQWAGFVS
jgi:hypothetical protein